MKTDGDMTVLLSGSLPYAHMCWELAGAAGVTTLRNPLSSTRGHKSGLVSVVGNIAASKLVE